MQKETLDSLILQFLPTHGHTYETITEENLTIEPTKDVHFFLFQMILTVLRKEAGFCIPKVCALTKRCYYFT